MIYDAKHTVHKSFVFNYSDFLSLPFICMVSVLNKDFNAVDSQDICFISITPSVSEKSEDFKGL